MRKQGETGSQGWMSMQSTSLRAHIKAILQPPHLHTSTPLQTPLTPGRWMVVLDTTSPSTPSLMATAAMSSLSTSVRSGAIFTRSGGGPCRWAAGEGVGRKQP